VTWDNRIIWSEGTFLQPQHFQQHDRHIDAQVELRTRSMRPYSWGFLELAIDESLLELGKLGLRTARGVLPDGTPFDCPARDPLPPPMDVPATLRDSLVVLALPLRRPGVDESDLGSAGADSLARYVAGELEVKDSNASFDRTALIQIGRLRLRLLKEADVSAAYSGLGVARVIERRATTASCSTPGTSRRCWTSPPPRRWPASCATSTVSCTSAATRWPRRCRSPGRAASPRSPSSCG